MEKFGDESRNIIKICAFLRSAPYLINKIINNINLLNRYQDWDWFFGPGGSKNLEGPAVPPLGLPKPMMRAYFGTLFLEDFGCVPLSEPGAWQVAIWGI